MSERKIAIGTAQFGLDYGVSNRTGRVSEAEAHRILAHAWEQGIDTADTATAYGCSEEVLGRFPLNAWKVISKIGAVPAGREPREWVCEEVERSLGRLQVSSIYGLLLHRADELLEPHGDAVYEALDDLKCQGKVQKIGVSVYSPSDLESICGRYACDIVQAPLNLVDRRILESGWVEKLKSKGVELHVRSVFLQGLLLMSQEAMPPYFQEWSSLWSDFGKCLRQNQISPLDACLRFVCDLKGIDRIVVGVESFRQIQEILLAVEGKKAIVFPEIGSTDVRLLNPSLWSPESKK